jgi:hypothetical protein
MFTFDQLKTANGITRTKSLFYELSYHDSEYAIFTTKEQDHITPDGRKMVSLQQLYVAMVPNDPTEEDPIIAENYLRSSRFRSSGYDGFMQDYVFLKRSFSRNSRRYESICCSFYRANHHCYAFYHKI